MTNSIATPSNINPHSLAFVLKIANERDQSSTNHFKRATENETRSIEAFAKGDVASGTRFAKEAEFYNHVALVLEAQETPNNTIVLGHIPA